MKTKNTDKSGTINKSKKILVEPCIFPFKYKDKDYTTCYKGGKGGWCATEVDPKTNKFTKWAYCDYSLPTKVTKKKINKLVIKQNHIKEIFANIYTKQNKVHKNKNIKAGKCIFPFIYNKKEYNECYSGKNGDWCATEVDSNKKLLKYGYCINSIEAQNNKTPKKEAQNNKTPKKEAQNNKTKTKRKEAQNNKTKTKRKEAQNNKTNWVSKHFKDKNYAIVETVAQGDCFFDSIRLGLLSINEKVTIRDLRNHLYDSVNSNQFDLFKTLLTNAILQNDREVIQEYNFIQNIDTLQELKNKLLTPTFWANSWAIGIIEQSLNIKVLILNEGAFNSGDEDNITLCGDFNVADSEPICRICNIKLSQYSSFSDSELAPYLLKHKTSPDHKWVDDDSSHEITPRGYIIVTYSGNHYRLVTYQKKGFFNSVLEMPLNIVQQFYKRCVLEQKFKGIYSSIKEFRELSI